MIRLLAMSALFFIVSCDQTPTVTPRTVEEGEYVFVDTSRTTPAVGNVPESDERRLRVRTWIPRGGQSEGPTPLLLMSHGWGGSIDLFETFAQPLAMRGIAVAAVEYPRTSRNFEGGHEAGLVDYPEQPFDYLFALDRLIEATTDPSHALYQSFSPDHIVGLGHSLGGATLIRASRQACCADGRLKATIFLSPATFVNEVLLDEPEILEDGPPTLVAHGANDTVVGLEESEALIEAISGPTPLVVLKGADHASPIESETGVPSPDQEVFEALVAAFIEEKVRGWSGTFDVELSNQQAAGTVTVANPN